VYARLRAGTVRGISKIAVVCQDRR